MTKTVYSVKMEVWSWEKCKIQKLTYEALDTRFLVLICLIFYLWV